MITVKRNLAVCIALGLFASLAAGILLAVPANAGVRPAPNWTDRTCSAFARWEDKPTTAGLDKLVVFSLHLHRGYLQADVLELAADALTAKPDAGYVDVAAQYVGEDCYGGA